ncbi:MAG: YDG domain-containing protein [Sphaerochaetaceae bacterium]
MKKYLTLLLAIALILLSFVGCSDMMEKLGKISLTIALDTPDIDVATFSLEGTLSNSSTRVVWPDIATPRHTLSALKSGTWSLTVTAFDDDGEQLGVGTQQVDLKEGQIVETTLLVVFTQADPLPGVFTSSSPSRFDSFDGEVMGTTSAMEYKLASSPEDALYTACTEGTTILGAGIYLVRYAAAHGLHASEPISVTVPDYQPIQLTIGDPTLTTSKIYDGTVDISGSVSAGDLVGILGDDEVTVTAAATYDSKVAGSGKTITIGYTLSGADAGNYLKPVDKTETGLISKRPLTVSGTTITTEKTYDGSSSAAVNSHGILSGLVPGDEVLIQATATYDDKTAVSGKTITIGYTLSGADAVNYFKPVDTTEAGLISKRPLTVSGTTVTTEKAYDGSTSAAVTLHGTMSGVVTGDDVSMQETATYDTKDAGEGKSITLTYALSGTDRNNYVSPDDSTATETGVIRQKQLTVSDLDLTTGKEYDGTNSVAVPTYTLEGKVAGEDVTVTAEATYDAIEAAVDREITVTYTLAGSDAGNYLKPANKTVVGLIQKKQLSMEGTTVDTTKEYDGLVAATITSEGTLSGVISGDFVTVEASATYDAVDAADDREITVTYTLAGSDAGNYLKPANKTVMGLIQRKQLTMVVGATVDTTKEYDGLVAATITSEGILSGVISGDSVTAEASATYDDKTAGSGKTITIGYTLSGADAGNYFKPTNKTVVGLISKIPLAVSGTTVEPEKAYNGFNTAKVNSHGTLSGLVTGDDVSMQETATYDTKDAGEGKSITLTYVLSGTDKDNYVTPVDSIISQAGVITPKQLYISIDGNIPSTKVYDGTASAAAPTFSLIGKVPSDSVVATPTATYDSSTAGTGKRISIVYSLSGTDKDNYIKPNDLLTTPSCTIIQKQLTISAPTLESVTKTYDGTTAVHGTVTPGSLSGVLEGDDVTVGATANHESANVTYATGLFNPITIVYTLDGTNASNYAPPVWDRRSGAIEPKQLSVIDTLFPASKVYDKTDTITITSPGTLSGLIEGDDVILNNVAAYYSGTDNANVGTDKAVAIYYTIEGEDKYNYTLDSNTSRKASITPALLTATVGDYTQTYGENPPNFKVDVSGFVGDEIAADIAEYTSPTASAGTNSSSVAGTYTIAISGGSAPNYIFDVSDTGTLTIQKPAGPAISGTIAAYFPNSNESQTIINVTGFTPNQTGIEAQVALYGTYNLDYADIAIDSRGRAMLYTPSAVTTATKIRFRVKETSSHAPGAATEIALVARPLAIGDYYEGGIVAYISTSSTLAEETHGLIAAKSDISSTGVPWSNSTTTIVGTSSGIGTGLSNTDKIVTSLGYAANSYAAGKARYYTGGGYTDWFLPSKDELRKLRLMFDHIGNFTTPAFYWSSTEESMSTVYEGDTVYTVEFAFTSGNVIIGAFSMKTWEFLVRPVRYF